MEQLNQGEGWRKGGLVWLMNMVKYFPIEVIPAQYFYWSTAVCRISNVYCIINESPFIWSLKMYLAVVVIM